MSASGASPSFSDDDFFHVYETYFREIVESGRPYFAPAGIEFSDPWPSEQMEQPFIHPRQLHSYFNAATKSIQPYQTAMSRFFSEWDQTEYDANNFTLTPSITTGSLLVLDFLRRNNIKQIIFETPCYYASLFQARDMGLNTVLIPTYLKDAFALSHELISAQPSPKAIWLTQPRISLGKDQTPEDITALFDILSDSDFVVVDEATELRSPSIMATLQGVDRKRLIRLRGVFKALAINGPRIAAIQTDDTRRRNLQENVWQFQGGVDVFSLELMQKVSLAFDRHRVLLSVALDKLGTLRRELAALTIGSPVAITPLINGYTGALVCDLASLASSKIDARICFLERLREAEVVATLGASMHFAQHSGKEFIRINAANSHWIVLESVRRIVRILSI